MPLPPEKRTTWIGVACCAVSALSYSLGNICMRQLTTLQCDPIGAVFSRELVTSMLLAPWLLREVFFSGGKPVLPSRRIFWQIVVVGLVVELGGNIGVQWAFGIVGLAVTVPAVYGASVASAGVLGYFALGEKVSFRTVAAIVVLLAALALLGQGAEVAGRSDGLPDVAASSPTTMVLGVLAGGLAGVIFALLSTTIRHSVTQTASPLAVGFLVPFMGVLSLGPLTGLRLGLEPLETTSWQQAALVMMAGGFNLVGFLSVIHGLQRITVVHANVISASQVAMAAVAGVLIFHEPPNFWLVLGISLTIAGIMSFDHPTEGGSV